MHTNGATTSWKNQQRLPTVYSLLHVPNGETLFIKGTGSHFVLLGYIFYATETYIMDFLEAAQFLNAPVLAGRKVNLLYAPGLAARLPLPLQLLQL